MQSATADCLAGVILFCMLVPGGNLKLGFYAKICLIQNQYEDIVIYQILLYIQCISSAQKKIKQHLIKIQNEFFRFSFF